VRVEVSRRLDPFLTRKVGHTLCGCSVGFWALSVANWPRFGYDTLSRRIPDGLETVCETQSKAVCIISIRPALSFPRWCTSSASINYMTDTWVLRATLSCFRNPPYLIRRLRFKRRASIERLESR
jgi:hypothetical protein